MEGLRKILEPFAGFIRRYRKAIAGFAAAAVVRWASKYVELGPGFETGLTAFLVALTVYLVPPNTEK